MQKVDKKFEKGDLADREILKTIKKSMIQLMREVDRVKNKIDKRPKGENKNPIKSKKVVKAKIAKKSARKAPKRKKK